MSRKCHGCARRIVRVRVLVCEGDAAPRHYCRRCAATLHDVPSITHDGRAMLARFVRDWNTHGRAYAASEARS